MNAVIIYNDPVLAGKAAEILRCASERANEGVQWNVKPWHLDILSQHPLQSAAFGDAAEAHVIVLAVRNADPFPSGLLGWLEIWAWCRQVKDAALAVYDGRNDGNGLACKAHPRLAEFAQRHGLSLISGDAIPTEDESAVYQDKLHTRELSLASAQAHSMDRYSHGRGWGLDE
jgi:hypothetical protein